MFHLRNSLLFKLVFKPMCVWITCYYKLIVISFHFSYLVQTVSSHTDEHRELEPDLAFVNTLHAPKGDGHILRLERIPRRSFWSVVSEVQYRKVLLRIVNKQRPSVVSISLSVIDRDYIGHVLYRKLIHLLLSKKYKKYFFLRN